MNPRKKKEEEKVPADAAMRLEPCKHNCVLRLRKERKGKRKRGGIRTREKKRELRTSTWNPSRPTSRSAAVCSSILKKRKKKREKEGLRRRRL